MNLIRKWLEEDMEYWSGVKLYEKYGGNDTLKGLLNIGKTAFNQNKLKTELEALAAVADLDNVVIDPIKSVEVRKPIEYFSLPDDIQELHRLKGKIYRECGILHAQLHTMDDYERSEAVRQIVEGMNQNQEIWEKIKYYEEHGHLKPENKTEVMPELEGLTEVELMRLKTNNATRISKLRLKLKKVTDLDKKKSDEEKLAGLVKLQEEVIKLL